MNANQIKSLVLELTGYLSIKPTTEEHKSALLFEILRIQDAINQFIFTEIAERFGSESAWEESARLFKDTESCETEAFCDYIQALLNLEDQEEELVYAGADQEPYLPGFNGDVIPSGGVTAKPIDHFKSDEGWEDFVPPLPSDVVFDGVEPSAQPE